MVQVKYKDVESLVELLLTENAHIFDIFYTTDGNFIVMCALPTGWKEVNTLQHFTHDGWRVMNKRP